MSHFRQVLRRIGPASLVVLLLLFVFPSIGSVEAQEPAVIEGVVTNAATGEPVAGVLVNVLAGGILNIATSEADGRYRTPQVALGEAAITAAGTQEMQPFELVAQLVEGTQTIDIALVPAEPATEPVEPQNEPPAQEPQLAFTGTATTVMVISALAAVILGAALVLAAKKRLQDCGQLS